MAKSFVSLHDLTLYEFHSLLDLARQVKTQPQHFRNRLAGKALAIVFAPPTPLSRLTFELGMRQMGGEAVHLPLADGEDGALPSLPELGRSLERWVDGIVCRATEHQQVLETARSIRVPLINGGTGIEAPCQAMADMLTIKENRRDLASARLAYIGAGNGACHSLIQAAAKAGIVMRAATPEGFEPDAGIVQQAESAGRDTGFSLQLTHDAAEAVSQADVVYTSPWPDSNSDLRPFEPYRVTSQLMAQAAPEVLLMHAPHLSPGREVAEDVVASSRATAFEQSENSLHIQKAIMVSYLKDYQRDDE